MIFHDPRGGCGTNGARYGLCVLGRTFSFVHSDAPLVTVRARHPHPTLNFISSCTLRVKQKNLPEGEKIPLARVLPPAVILTCSENYTAL